LVLLVS